MAITADVTRVAANVGAGTQDITIPGFGTPKAAIFIMTRAIADGVAAVDANFNIGFTDGLTDHALSVTSEDGQATTDASTRVYPAHCIGNLDPGTTTIEGEAIFDSWIVDGVRIDWTNALSNAYLLEVILLGGDDLSVFVGSQPLTNTVDTAHVVNNVPFESHLVIPICATARRSASPAGTQSRRSIGVVHNDTAGGITPRCHILFDRDNQAAGAGSTQISTLYGGGGISSVTGAISWGAEFSAFTANGFTITQRISGSINTEMYYLCLRGSAPTDFAVGTHSTPTGIGEDSETGVGFKPQLTMLGMSQVEAVNAGEADADAGTGGIAAFTDTDEFSFSASSEIGADPTNTQSLSDDTAVEIPDDDGTAGITASFVSFDPLGYTLNYSAVKGTARQFWYMAIKSPTSPAGGDTFNEHPWVVPTTWYLPYWKHR